VPKSKKRGERAALGKGVETLTQHFTLGARYTQGR